MPVISDEGLELISAKFHEHDTEGTGFLTAAQLCTAFTPICEALDVPVPDTDRIQARLAALQTEKEGHVNLIEMIFLFGYLKVMIICTLLFEAADEDGSGTLNPAETKTVIQTVCDNNGYECPSDAMMDEFLAEIGGAVTFEMFASVAIPRILELSGLELVEETTDTETA